MKSNYPKTCGIYNPVSFLIKEKTGKAIEIKKSWYDILVLEDSLRRKFERGNKVILDSKTKGIQLLEIKASEKDGGSFGAFTIGELYAASKSRRTGFFGYHFLYVQHGNLHKHTKISELPLTNELLKDMMAFPQYKLYFYRSLYEKYVLKKKDVVIGRKKERASLEQKLDRVLLDHLRI